MCLLLSLWVEKHVIYVCYKDEYYTTYTGDLKIIRVTRITRITRVIRNIVRTQVISRRILIVEWRQNMLRNRFE